MEIDDIALCADVARLRTRYADAAAAALAEPPTYAAGYATGWCDALHEVILMLQRAPLPVKATGAKDWSDTARAWFAKAQERDQKDVLVDYNPEWAKR